MSGRIEHIGEATLYLGDWGHSADIAEGGRCSDGPALWERADKGKAGGAMSFNGNKPIPRMETNDDWDQSRPPAELLTACVQHGRFAILWGGNYFADLLPHKVDGCGGTSARRCRHMETVNYGLICRKQPQSGLSMQTTNCLQIASNVFIPRKKPEQVMRWCLGFLPDAQNHPRPLHGQRHYWCCSGSNGPGLHRHRARSQVF